MSIAEFSSAVKSRIFKSWLDLDNASNPIVSSDVHAKLTRVLTASGVPKIELEYTISSAETPSLQPALDSEVNKATTRLNKTLSNISIVEKILNLRGSPSFVDILRAGLIKALKGKEETTRVTSPSVQVHKKKPGAGQLRDKQGRFYSLALLKELINDSLPHVISAYMGNQPYPGGQRRILNFRTGRFANSANVERLVQGKSGMITAFYDYMKYPYQTFEPGYAQGQIKSRDPKLLISKSIRDIAATKVDNRMRSILV